MGEENKKMGEDNRKMMNEIKEMLTKNMRVSEEEVKNDWLKLRLKKY